MLGGARTWGLVKNNTTSRGSGETKNSAHRCYLQVFVGVFFSYLASPGCIPGFAGYRSLVFFYHAYPTFGLRPSRGAKLFPHYRGEGIFLGHIGIVYNSSSVTCPSPCPKATEIRTRIRTRKRTYVPVPEWLKGRGHGLPGTNDSSGTHAGNVFRQLSGTGTHTHTGTGT